MSVTTRRGSYVPAFDGLRALAVVGVLAFHFRLRGIPFRDGGYLGVDLFFVLSGFLITSLLLAERSRIGDISLRRFYARRALRLLPLVGILLVLAAIVTVFSAPSYPWRSPPMAFVAVATYPANGSRITPYPFGDL